MKEHTKPEINVTSLNSGSEVIMVSAGVVHSAFNFEKGFTEIKDY